MALSRDQLENFFSSAFPEAKVTLTDLAGDNDHWSVEIVSKRFNGMGRVAQHKMVYAALEGKMGGQLHALQVVTKGCL